MILGYFSQRVKGCRHRVWSWLTDLTPQPAFARLRDAADLAESARSVSRAEVAELADARGSGPRTRKGVGAVSYTHLVHMVDTSQTPQTAKDFSV